LKGKAIILARVGFGILNSLNLLNYLSMNYEDRSFALMLTKTYWGLAREQLREDKTKPKNF
jgi:hypothetical protein